MKYQLLISATLAALWGSAANAGVPTYSNTFISYDSPSYVNSLLDYSSEHNVGGMIMWEASGDLAATSKDSLLYQVAHTQVSNPPQVVELFWPDWSTERNYGSDGLPVWGSGGTAKYRDTLEGQKLSDQIVAAQSHNSQAVVAYSFVESNSDGSLKAYDPWADLQPDDATWCSQTSNFCQGTPTADTTSFGSIDQFLALKDDHPGLKTIMAFGGWGHEADIDNAIAHPDTFAQSYSKLNEALGSSGHPVFDGINFDYESADKDGLATKFKGLVTLIKAFHQSNPESFISVDLMGDDKFLAKIKPDLQALSDEIPNIHFDIMSYDFHGAFDYGPNAANKTGLLSRIYNGDDQNDFSIEKEMAALQGINPQNISLGFAAYGRALSNISSNNGSLFEGVIKADSLIPIEYDMDDHGPNFVDGYGNPKFRCSVQLSDSRYPACDGMYPWSYIHNSMLTGGFKQVEVKSGDKVTGVYAQNLSSWTPSQPSAESGTLTINITADPTYYYNSLTVTDDADPKQVTLNNLQPNTPFNLQYPATDGESSLHFDFFVNGNHVQCDGLLPKDASQHLDFSKSLTVTRSGSPYNSSDPAKCTVTVS
ncbi:glycosyl hydrolase family 18 protein [Vibrio profundum]|uniref:glycosyl hydrolase family 18 protein n=1 Tax=Vibrio profundum TaxID=2910247 RepID=UPI003D0B3AF5